MVSVDEVKSIIENYLEGSTAVVNNPRDDDVHFAVEVTWSGFKGLSRIEQQRKVYAAFNNDFSECGMPLHALQMKCIVPDTN
ncbi:MAG: BolA/IbaG family iron-sulfur metabolism protein [Nanoarchaeota archaeon]|nr:BolA/IbaG family iron-sulfur metabolism protein [Nanoarchaeota archaeon]